MKAKGTSFVEHFQGITERMFKIRLESSLWPYQDPALCVSERPLILRGAFPYESVHPLIPLENKCVTTDLFAEQQVVGELHDILHRKF